MIDIIDGIGNLPQHNRVFIENLRRPSYQARVFPWLITCFGAEVTFDYNQRNFRFLEEALELVQANGCSREDALRLVNYVYDRPAGEPFQEAGGALLTLAALCIASGINLEEAGEMELARVWSKMPTIRAKQAAKVDSGPLPGPSEVRVLCDGCDGSGWKKYGIDACTKCGGSGRIKI